MGGGDMDILITGYENDVSRTIAQYLLAVGHRVRALTTSRLESFCARAEKSPGLPFDLVIHNPSSSGVLDDIVRDARVFRWAAQSGQRRMIYFSSHEAYPALYKVKGYRLCELDLEVDQPRVPSGAMGRIKVVGEQLAVEARADGVNVQVVRPFRVYGGETNHDVHQFLLSVLRRDPLITMWGPLDQTQDYIHIDDVACSVGRLVEMPDFKTPVNLCSGVAMENRAFAKHVFHAAGWVPQMLEGQPTPKDPHVVGDPLHQHMLWIPRVTVANGVERELLDTSLSLDVAN